MNPPSTASIGLGRATVRVNLKDTSYYSVQSESFNFNVTILDVATSAIGDRQYTLGSQPLPIQFSPFKIIPFSYNVGPAYY